MAKMLAAKILVFVTIAFTMPFTFSRHVPMWDQRIFPHDAVERRFPSANIQDFQIPEIALDVNPDIEDRRNFGDETNTENENSEVQELENLGNEMNKQKDNSDVRELVSPEMEVNTQNENPEVKVVDSSEEQDLDTPVNTVNTENENPEVQGHDNSGNDMDTPNHNPEIQDQGNSGSDDNPEVQVLYSFEIEGDTKIDNSEAAVGSNQAFEQRWM